MSFEDHEKSKDDIKCVRENIDQKEKCGATMIQSVGSANFKLTGGGWFDQDYSITQMEMDKNIDDSAKMEDFVQKEMRKDGVG
jgi:predicted nucleic acid-binding Zn ribbon protein